MTTKEELDSVSLGWRSLNNILSRLATNTGRPEPNFINYPVYRGSTVIHPSVNSLTQYENDHSASKFVYGARGNPNQFVLEDVVREIEGGQHTQLLSSGLAACALPLMAYLGSADHCLMVDTVYAPVKRLADTLLNRFGIEVEYFPPALTEDDLRRRIRSNTRMIYIESPGSHSFEVLDVDMITKVAHSNSVRVCLDNTWGIGIFKPFEHGVDISVQAMTKYPSGHSDIVMGAVTVNTSHDWQIVTSYAVNTGQYAQADDSWLMLRGLRTMAVRLEQQSRSAYQVACWLKLRPEIHLVLHPALPDNPGYSFWKRDFAGASSLFSFLFRSDITVNQVEHFINTLTHIRIGYSWGGFDTLIIPIGNSYTSRNFPSILDDRAGCRLYVGLNDPEILIGDLDNAMGVLS